MARLLNIFSGNDVAARRKVVFVPGNLFFMRTLPLPDRMSEEDVESFAELTLEEMSPFSLEQLAWGYQTDSSNRWVIIMALCRPRVPASLLAEWDDAVFVLPSFYPLLLQDTGHDIPTAVLYEHCLTLAHYEEGCPLPTRFTHHPLDEEEEAAPAALATLASQPEAGNELLLLNDSVENLDGEIELVLSTQKLGDEAPAELPSISIDDVETLWRADLREVTFKKQEQKARKLSAGLWKGILVAGVLAAVLIVSAIGWLGLQGWLSARMERIETQTPYVMALDLKQKNLEDLKQFAGAPFRPFEVLGALNEVRREKTKGSGVYFVSTAVDKDNEVTVKGRASNIGEVNRYADALLASGRFEQETPPEYRTRGARTDFTLNMRYIPLPEIVPLEEPESMATTLEEESV